MCQRHKAFIMWRNYGAPSRWCTLLLCKGHRYKKLLRKKDSRVQRFYTLSPYINNIYTYTTTSYLASLNAFWAWLTWRSTDTLYESQSIEWVAFEDAHKVSFECGLNSAYKKTQTGPNLNVLVSLLIQKCAECVHSLS